eukprot:GFUD01009817.1.p1 GENE.GFUD01009817.1~~GFUD01009817.1.p1  ORF type:complete len:506 (+),score=132.07 GFUD01009817.1:639-2156(+)
MSSINQDKTANRVALCSAIFAGFAYVGYAVVRQAFGGRKVKSHGFFRNENDLLGLEYETEPRGKVYLRRLSGSACSGGKNNDLVGTLRSLDNDQEGQIEGIQCILRPLSVRERIRDLNLTSMAFADTLLILHGKKPLTGPRSLQSTPFHSPTRILSPVDLHHQFLCHDPDRDTNANISNFSHPPTPKLSRRSSRRNLSRRSLANSVINLTEEEQEEADAQAQTLLNEKEAELTRRLEGFQSSRPRELTPYESKSLVALLHSNDKDKIARTLVTISNCAAFTRNQDSLREAGILVRLPSLLAGPDRSVQLAAVMACANLALNTGNMKEMEQAVVVLVLLADDRARDLDPEFLSNTLLALTNIAVLPDWHYQFHPLLPRLLELWHSAPNTIKFQSLRLLINLACNDETIPHLLAARCEVGVVKLVVRTTPEDQLLRSATLLSNIYMSSTRQGLAERGQYGTLQGVLFGSDRSGIVKEVGWLMENHQNYDIRLQARKIHTVLEGINME